MAISIHAPRVGSDICRFKTCSLSAIFQSTLPVWGATSNVKKCTFCGGISIHAPRVGSDTPESTTFRPSPISIHAPRVGSDSMAILSACGGRISIHAPRVGSDRRKAKTPLWKIISIHAPRVGSDEGVAARGCAVAISIHAPRVGSDCRCLDFLPVFKLFQSTLPVWGATRAASATSVQCTYFNPRSPCGERQDLRQLDLPGADFNPRSPCGERPEYMHFCSKLLRFQSTLPVWGATAKLHNSSPAILRKSDNSLLFLPDFHRPDNFMEHTSAP